MPKDFLLDVRSRIQEISQGEEGVEIDYENHSLFTDEEDRQALSWLQRLGISFNDHTVIV